MYTCSARVSAVQSRAHVVYTNTGEWWRDPDKRERKHNDFVNNALKSYIARRKTREALIDTDFLHKYY